MNLDAPHRLAVEQALHALDSGHHGLGLAEVARRARQCGPNRLPRRPPPSLLAVLLRQLRDPMILVLAIAALVATVLSDWSDVAFIALVIVIDVVGGFSAQIELGDDEIFDLALELAHPEAGTCYHSRS